jgi:lipid A 3-O-deacylase
MRTSRMTFSLRRTIQSTGVVCLLAGSLLNPAMLNAKTSTPAGTQWHIVNEAFSAAVQQQAISNRSILPSSIAYPAYIPPPTPQALPPSRIPVSSTPSPSAVYTKSGRAPAPIIETAAAPTAPKGKWGWLSEIRGGILKHSVPISTSTPKEEGIDGNIEVLFTSPDWLDVLWSPRPHIGASFNASSEDTDQIYTGLTWEWEPFKNFFVDASFGFSGHNGRLHIDGSDENAGRQREFGCKVLFRESIEFGYRIMTHHSVSVMWDHISHGGLCDDENEGMDNAGVRYGYKF